MNNKKLSLQERENLLERYDLAFVFEKIYNDGVFPKSLFQKLEQELKKFFKLVLREDQPLAMIDKRVDEVWHSFILFTPQYQSFCEMVMGFFVHHQPRTSYTPIPISSVKNFVDAYTLHFGDLDPFWYETLDPEMYIMVNDGVIPESLISKWSGWTGKKFPINDKFQLNESI